MAHIWQCNSCGKVYDRLKAREQGEAYGHLSYTVDDFRKPILGESGTIIKSWDLCGACADEIGEELNRINTRYSRFRENK